MSLKNRSSSNISISNYSIFILQDLKFNGNIMTRIPTEALIGPESLQNLQLQDNLIGKCKLLFLASIVVSIYLYIATYPIKLKTRV